MIIVLYITITLFIVLLTDFIYKHLSRRWRNEPPGPWGLPILGYSPFLKPRAFKAFMRIKSKHPDIAQMDFGSQRMIFLNSYETIKEALLTKGDNFAGRRHNILLKKFGVGEGLAESEGEVWKEHRRFALRTLRDFGLGRNQSELIIQKEIHSLNEIIEREVSHGNDHIDVMLHLMRSISNVICTLTMGDQMEYEAGKNSNPFQHIHDLMNHNIFTAPGFIFPKLAILLTPLLLKIPSAKRAFEALFATFRSLQERIDDHEKEFDPSHEDRDYIDAFLKQKHSLDSTNPGNHVYTSQELQRIVLDLYVAGTDTTSNSLSWGLLLLAIHSDIQTRCHGEIDSTIGRDRQPSMKDKEQMPYIQAVLDEVQRYATIAPIGVVHRNFEDDTIHGYFIPGDSLIVPFVYGVHHDPRVWERPEEFHPEHFLTIVDGSMKYKSREELIPFLIGKRNCLGESLAKMELFLFFVSVLQKFEVRLPSSLEDKDKLEEVLLGTDGIVNSPGHHELVFIQRC